MARTPFIGSRAWIPEEMLDLGTLENWTFPVYNESECNRCPKANVRPKDCVGCPAFEEMLHLYRRKETPEGNWWGLPNGNLARIADITGVECFDDKRPRHEFTHPIKFKFSLYTGDVVNGKPTVDQRSVIDEWKKQGFGLIKAPPRAGKTIMSVAASIETGCKTLIVAHESRLIEQFYKTFLMATNVGELQEETGKTLIKVLEDPVEDLANDDLQIALTTYQKFIRKESRNERIKLLNKKFSTVVVDEVHQASSTAYARFLSALSCKYKLGLSATPFRKDGLDFVMEQVWGPIVAEASTIALVPRIELVETGMKIAGNPQQWTTAIKRMSESKKRNKFIIEEVFADIKAGRKAIIIPVDHKAAGLTLTEQLNEEARKREKENGEDYNMSFAAFYTAKSKKEGLIDKFDNGEVSVLVAIRSMIKQGVDFQLADALYMVIPMSSSKNKEVGAPLFQQLAYRVGTWVPGKKDPVLKLFVDDHFFSYMTFKGLMGKEVLPGIRSVGGAPPKYKMNLDDERRARMIMRAGAGYEPVNKPGERITSTEAIKRRGALK